MCSLTFRYLTFVLFDNGGVLLLGHLIFEAFDFGAVFFFLNIHLTRNDFYQ